MVTISIGRSEPVRYKVHKVKAQSICRLWVYSKILRRLMRSASTPAYGVNKTAGNNPAIDETPSQVELPVMS